jgi:hypothetical protein
VVPGVSSLDFICIPGQRRAQDIGHIRQFWFHRGVSQIFFLMKMITDPFVMLLMSMCRTSKIRPPQVCILHRDSIAMPGRTLVQATRNLVQALSAQLQASAGRQRSMELRLERLETANRGKCAHSWPSYHLRLPFLHYYSRRRYLRWSRRCASVGGSLQYKEAAAGWPAAAPLGTPYTIVGEAAGTAVAALACPETNPASALLPTTGRGGAHWLPAPRGTSAVAGRVILVETEYVRVFGPIQVMLPKKWVPKAYPNNDETAYSLYTDFAYRDASGSYTKLS